MKYRYLGKSGLAVSTICLGTATFGQKDWGCDEKTSIEILNAYKNNGGNFIDTSDKYGDTNSERIIGKWLKEQRRDDFVIGTKCFSPTGKSINDRGLSKKHIMKACDDSLRRLGTDYIDLYQIHEMDLQTPIEETLETLSGLVKIGKVRYIGLSNQPAWRITKSLYISKEKNYSRFISGQYLYNLLKRNIENEIIHASRDAGMGIICWSPLSGGMLTGKYIDSNEPIQNSRLNKRIEVTKDKYKLWYSKSIKIITKVKDIAVENNITASIVSLSWLLKNPIVASTIIGATKSEQIIENIKACNFVLADEDYKLLNELSEVPIDYPFDVIQNVNKDWFKQIL